MITETVALRFCCVPLAVGGSSGCGGSEAFAAASSAFDGDVAAGDVDLVNFVGMEWGDGGIVPVIGRWVPLQFDVGF